MIRWRMIILMLLLAALILASSCRSTENLPKNSTNRSTTVTGEPTQKDPPVETGFEQFHTISELNRQNPKEGIFETRGFVVKIYTCPLCPPDSQCKPCMKDNIVISEENKDLENYNLSNKNLIIFVKEPKSFEKGREYLFKIRVTDQKTTSAKLKDIEILASKEIKD